MRAPVVSLLILLLAITGIGLGMARGALAADRQLCATGATPLVLAHDGLPLFDATGAPVTLDKDPCLDCVLAACALPPEAAGAGLPAIPPRAVQPPHAAAQAPSRAMPGGQARAPPLRTPRHA